MKQGFAGDRKELRKDQCPDWQASTVDRAHLQRTKYIQKVTKFM